MPLLTPNPGDATAGGVQFSRPPKVARYTWCLFISPIFVVIASFFAAPSWLPPWTVRPFRLLATPLREREGGGHWGRLFDAPSSRQTEVENNSRIFLKRWLYTGGNPCWSCTCSALISVKFLTYTSLFVRKTYSERMHSRRRGGPHACSGASCCVWKIFF